MVVLALSFSPVPATVPGGDEVPDGASAPASAALKAISSSASTLGLASAPVKVPASAYTVVVKPVAVEL